MAYPAHGSANWDTALKTWTDAAYTTFTSVKHPDYGATGNGATDDTTAVAAAIAAAKAAGRTVYFPAGTYKISADQTVDWDYATIIGDGANTILNFVGCGLVVDGTAAYRFRTTLRDLRINRTGTAGPALLIKGAGNTTGAARFTLDNIDIKASTGDGMEIAGSFIGTVIGSYFRECTGRGVYLHKDLGVGNNKVNAVIFQGGEIQSNTGGGVELVDNNRDIAFFGTCIEDNGTFGARVNSSDSVIFEGCYIENNSVIDLLVGDVGSNTAVAIRSCIFDNAATGKTKAVNLVRAVGTTVDGNTFFSYGANPPIAVNEATAGAVIGSAYNNTQNGGAASTVALNGALKFIGIDDANTAYVPTTTGITVGNGSVSGHWTRNGKMVDFYAWFVFGSTSAITGNPTLGLPVPALGRAANFGYGIADIFDTSASATFDARWVANSSTTVIAKGLPGTAGAALVNLSATVPMTWAAGDVLTISGSYEAA